MPYEAAVPVHRRLLWPAVTDPERLLGALPNAVVEASAGRGAAGRLRLRLRDQSVTFRGVARVTRTEAAQLRTVIEVEASFGRAGGSVEGTVEVRLRAAGPGTRVVIDGALTLSEGAVPFPAEALESALTRLVQRWFAALAETSPRAAASGSAEAASTEHGDEEGQREKGPEPHGVDAGGKRMNTLRAVAAAERSGLSVVRDVSDGHAQGTGPDGETTGPQPVPATDAGQDSRLRPVKDPVGKAPHEPEPSPLTRRPPTGEPPTTVQLRLVPISPEPAQDALEAGGPGPSDDAPTDNSGEKTGGAAESDPPRAAADHDPAQTEDQKPVPADGIEDEDLWSRLCPGRRVLKLPGALSPAGALGLLLAASAVLFAVLRRRRR